MLIKHNNAKLVNWEHFSHECKFYIFDICISFFTTFPTPPTLKGPCSLPLRRVHEIKRMYLDSRTHGLFIT